ncbi:MAG: DUF1559 domain-containing protein [Planctomycetota bacterium]
MTILAKGYSLRFLTAWAVLLSPLAAAQAQTPSAPASPAPAGADYLTPASVAVVSLKPGQVLTNPALAMLPVEVAEAAGEKFLGMKATDIRRVVAVGEAPMGMVMFYAVAIEDEKPWELSRLAPELVGHTEAGEIAGRDALVSREPTLPSMVVVDDTTLMVGTQPMIEKLLSAGGGQAAGAPAADGGTLATLAAAHTDDDLYAAVDLEKLRPLIQFGLMQGRKEVPPEFQKFLDIPTMLDSVELSLTLDGSRSSSLVAHTSGPVAASRVERLIDEGVDVLRAQMTEGMEQNLEQLRASDDPVERAMAAYADRMSGGYLDLFTPKRVDESFVLFDTGVGQGAQMSQVAIIGVVVALLLPAVQAAREAARRTQSMNNIKQLMLAMLNYEAARRELPAQAICDAEGKPLLSWRVAILPYIEEQALYEQFHLDEPWDSEHNRKLIPLMPAVYRDPSSPLPLDSGKSSYAGVSGERYLMTGAAKGRRFREITDGTSRSIAVVEVSDDSSPIWTQPVDWSPAAANPTAGLGDRHPGGFLVGFCDGYVRFIDLSIDAETFKKLLTVNGREVINNDDY